MIDSNVKVYRWPMPLGPADPLIARWEIGRVNAACGGKKRHESWERRHRNWLKMSQANWSKVFPEPDGAAYFARCYPILTAAARHLHRTAGFDLVAATAGPWVDLSVVLHLGAEFGVPTFYYDRDAWMFKTFTGEPHANAADIEPLQAQILDLVTQAWYVNESIAQLHRQQFPQQVEKIKVVPNGWDREFLPGEITPPNRAPGRGLTFRYVGTIPSGFPLETLTEAWRKARESDEVVARSRLEIVGANYGPAFGPGLASLGISHRERISRTALARVFGETDVLVFMVPGGPLVTSSRIYEYAATGLPIVAGVAPDHSAQKVLAGRDLVFQAGSVESNALSKAIIAAASRAPTPAETAQAHRHAEALNRDMVLDSAIASLEVALRWT